MLDRLLRARVAPLAVRLPARVAPLERVPAGARLAALRPAVLRPAVLLPEVALRRDVPLRLAGEREVVGDPLDVVPADVRVAMPAG